MKSALRLASAAVGLLVGTLVALWRAVGRLAEMLSDAGHGWTAPHEEAWPDNAFAGEGPVQPLRDWEDHRPIE